MKYKVLSPAAFSTLSVMAFATVFAVGGASNALASTCTSLSHQMSYGDNDHQVGGEVTVLQSFLVSGGYVTATPNGHFGPATQAGVKAFQRAYGISAIGDVGPLTRAAIKLVSCSSASVTPVQTLVAPTTPQTSAQTVPQTPVAPTASPIVALTPAAGEKLNIGDTYTLKWSGPAGSGPYTIVLEDASGTPMGFITPRTYATQYSWKAGTVQNSSTASLDVVPPGTYRIHAESASQGSQSSDSESGLFTVADSVYISQIFPHAAAADGSTAVVMYGSNFKPASMVDIYGHGTVGPQYVSPDGRVIVFTIPTGVYPGPHSVSVINSYGSSDTKVESPSSSLTVIRP